MLFDLGTPLDTQAHENQWYRPDTNSAAIVLGAGCNTEASFKSVK